MLVENIQRCWIVASGKKAIIESLGKKVKSPPKATIRLLVPLRPNFRHLTLPDVPEEKLKQSRSVRSTKSTPMDFRGWKTQSPTCERSEIHWWPCNKGCWAVINKRRTYFSASSSAGTLLKFSVVSATHTAC